APATCPTTRPRASSRTARRSQARRARSSTAARAAPPRPRHQARTRCCEAARLSVNAQDHDALAAEGNARATLSDGPRYPDHLQLEVERHLEGLRFAEEPLTAGLERAMRYSL